MSKKQEDILASDFKNFHVPDIGNMPQEMSDVILDERETRKRLLNHARIVGCGREMLILLGKYDKIFRNCRNEVERRDIAKLASVEVFKLLGGYGNLVVDGQIVCKG
jgi:hypothetical protein